MIGEAVTGSRPQERIASSSDSAESGMFLRMLGSFEVWLDGRLVAEEAFPRRKAMALLKLLALQPEHQVHREQAFELLWPGLPPRSAGSQLYKAIHHVRQAFETVQPACPVDELIQVGGEMVRLSSPGGIRTDVESFEERARRAFRTRDLELLRDAVTNYGGDLLPTALYESWTADRRRALREQFTDLLIELGERYLALGRLGESADALQRALGQDQSREAAHRALMLVFARQGRRTRALRQYQVCADALANELGVEVSPETEALYEAILAGKVPVLEPSSFQPVDDVEATAPLVGRRAEMRSFNATLDRLAGGTGAVLAIEGDAGVGKTRLGLEILRLGRSRHWHTLFGKAHEQEGQMAYAPFVSALRNALWDNPTGAELIPLELASAIPEIPATAEIAGVADRVAAQTALFAGVLRFMADRARTAPVVLVLDDLQAADEGSMKLFHYLAREVSRMPLLLIGIWRWHDPETPLALSEMVNSLMRHQHLQLIELTGLSESDTRDLLEQTLDSGRLQPDLAGELFRLSEGNALFTREIARQLRANGDIVQRDGVWQLAGKTASFEDHFAHAIPRTLQVLTAQRLEPLSAPATELIQFSAAAGRDIPFSIFEAGWESSQPQTRFLNAVDEILATGLLVETRHGYHFSHPLFREAIYARMSHTRQRALHHKVAEALQTLHQHNPTAMPVDSLAHHYRSAGDTGRATQYLIEAGDRAEAVYDHEGALRRYREALDVLKDQYGPDARRRCARVWEMIGDVHRSTCDIARGLEAYLFALEALGDEETNSEALCDLHRKIALGSILTADLETAGRQLAQARALLGFEPLDEAKLLIVEALLDWHVLQFAAAVEHGTRALDIAEQAGDQAVTSQACEMLALAHLALGNWEMGMNYERRRGTENWSPEIAVTIDAHLCLYQYKFQTEESYQQIRGFFESVAQQSTDLGNLRCLAVCRFILGTCLTCRGIRVRLWGVSAKRWSSTVASAHQQESPTPSVARSSS